MCKSCKKAFINSVEEEKVCLECTARLRKLYPSVRNFLRNNNSEAYTIYDIGRIMNINLNDLDAMVSMGLLEHRKDSVCAARPKARR